MMRVEFLRLNRNVMLAAFIGMSETQVDTALTALGDNYTDMQSASRTTFTATSINNPGYIVVQLDRNGAVIPPAVKDLLRSKVNEIASGV